MSSLKSILLTCVIAGLSVPAFAGVLAVDGSSYGGIWHGSTPFQGTDPNNFNLPTDLVGYVDWAVYAPGTLPVGFIPNVVVPADEFVYAYQVFSTGLAPTSSFSVALENEANNPGWFQGGGVNGDAPFTSYIVPNDTANWLFNGILQGGTSRGLLFTSPNVPMLLTGTTIDHGSSAGVVPVPSPDSFPIPEPATFTLAIFGLAGFALQWARRRGRKI